MTRRQREQCARRSLIAFRILSISFFSADCRCLQFSPPSLSLCDCTVTPTRHTPSLFSNFVLGITDGLHDLGGIRLELAASLAVCWLIVFFCLVRGVKSIGKVVYFTALFPYFVLTILLARGLSLEGSGDGIAFYLTPDWKRLKVRSNVSLCVTQSIINAAINARN